MAEEKTLLGSLIDVKQYHKVKEYTYEVTKEKFAEVDARAIGVYWFIMALDLLAEHGMPKDLLKDGVDVFYEADSDKEEGYLN
jgi:hypothetical protein